jgi:hypothetical protein
VAPVRAHAVEALHWRLSNALRRLESDRGAATLVSGPCYLFRRALLSGFPEDVVADDAHVALLAAARGRGVRLAPVTVSELRSPVRLRDLFRHKLRKTDAYLREIFRFLPAAGDMPAPGRQLLRWRAAQLLVTPPLAAAAALLGLLAAGAHPALGITLVAALALWLPLRRRRGPIAPLTHAALLTAALLAALVAHPFRHQSASYARIPAEP